MRVTRGGIPREGPTGVVGRESPALACLAKRRSRRMLTLKIAVSSFPRAWWRSERRRVGTGPNGIRSIGVRLDPEEPDRNNGSDDRHAGDRPAGRVNPGVRCWPFHHRIVPVDHDSLLAAPHVTWASRVSRATLYVTENVTHVRVVRPLIYINPTQCFVEMLLPCRKRESVHDA